MSKTVGFACSIKLPWLKKTFDMLKQELDEKTFRCELNDFLSFEVDSPTRLRKIRKILMNIWYNDSDEINDFRIKAIELIDKYPNYFMPINLCMIYLTYPVFADVCKFMGHILEYQDEVTTALLKQKLYDTWGERGTLEPISQRVTQTLKDIGVLENTSNRRYKLKKFEINRNPVISFIIAVAMYIDGNSCYTFTDLTEFEELFPFEFNVSKEYILSDDQFVSTYFGGELTIALKE